MRYDPPGDGPTAAGFACDLRFTPAVRAASSGAVL